MKYTIRIKNDMFGYERDQIMQVEADNAEQAIQAGLKVDQFASITIQKIEEQTMNSSELDNLIRTELETVARGLADTILLEDLDYDDSLQTLEGVLTTLEYYSTKSEYLAFINSLPDAIFERLEDQETHFEVTDEGMDVVTASDSDLAHNLQRLGYKAYMAMAELGFISFEDMVNLAKLQLQSNGTKH